MICDDIFVTSSGEMKLKKAVHTVRRNGRKDFLLLYVCDGICEFVLNGVKSTAKKGDVILYYPGEAQRMRISFWRASIVSDCVPSIAAANGWVKAGFPGKTRASSENGWCQTHNLPLPILFYKN